MTQPIKVTYQVTSSAYKANQWLRSLPDLIACDFEAAVKYSPADLEAIHKRLEENPSKQEQILLKSRLAATALSHPSHVDLTHCQIAYSDHEAYVFIFDNKSIRNLILNFLITTTRTQIWHNATYDFQHICYHTNKFPLNYEDTQILAKTILNNVEVHKAKTGLKELAGHWYGSWAVSPDMFDKSQMYDKDLLLYAATDATATYKLYHSIKQYIKEQNETAT